jgi:1-phosphatidylinositol-4-phosphate 5-kinase
MICGKKKSKRKALEPVDLNIKIMCQRYRFTSKEFEDYQKEFKSLSDGNSSFTLQSFCEKMGPLGLEPTRLISDRIFAVMNKTKSGKVSIEEYLEYMDIIMHGTSNEKVLQSFRLITQDSSKTISYSQFESWMIKVWKMLNILTGVEVSATKENISQLFLRLDGKNDGFIDFEEFEAAMKDNSGIGEWFEIVNKQISQNLNCSMIRQKTSVFENIEQEINECIFMLKKGKSQEEVNEDFDCESPEILLDDSHFTRPRGDLDSFLTLEDQSNVFDSKRLDPDLLLSKLFKVLSSLQELKLSFPGPKPKQAPPFTVSRSQNMIRWGDSDWKLIMNMMIGIQKSVNLVSCDLNSELSSSEFLHKSKQMLPARCNKSSFKFTDYAPSIFYRLRNQFQVSSSEYISSLGVEKIVSSLMSNEFDSLSGQCSSGKSGSFFFISSDSRFLLKTLNFQEFSLFLKILPDYFFHMMRNPGSLLTKFFGLHKIVGEKSIHFVVMGNTFSDSNEIQQKFDLKGSTYGRTTDPSADWTVARKDLDFKEIMRVGNFKKKKILEQVEADVELLERMKIIDYSFLLGISDAGGKENEQGVLSVCQQKVYYFGIIDFFTKFGTKKKLEHFIMGTLHGKSKVSCVPPRKYAKRFISYLNKIIE